MESRHLSLPPPKNTKVAGNLAYQMAVQRLTGVDDLNALCGRSGAQCSILASTKIIAVEYLNHLYSVTLPDGGISQRDSTEPAPLRDRILILHYLLTARGTPLSGKLITFRELPDGAVYHPTFVKRTIQPLVKNFGADPGALLEAAGDMGAQRADYGDAGIIINAFKKVPVIIAMWRGDEEFPAQGNVLFDSSISDYLPTEDVTILSEIIVWRLVGARKPSA
ncbi:MAG: DUF3786 domain-containing protein [Chloroflexi bacterium]|nr:DUF3786 domain-containing protein [Chloroflexota bacterium]